MLLQVERVTAYYFTQKWNFYMTKIITVNVEWNAI